MGNTLVVCLMFGHESKVYVTVEVMYALFISSIRWLNSYLVFLFSWPVKNEL